MKIIFPILFILISIVLFIFFVNPLYKDVSVLRSEISIYDKALSNSTDLKKIQDSLLDTYKTIKQSDKDRLGSFLPSSVNNIQFVLEVERIANLHNMPIKDIKFESVDKSISKDANGGDIVVSEDVNDNKPYGVFPVEFTTEGKYDKFMLFLRDLEKNLRLIDIKSISFSIPKEDDSSSEKDIDPNIYRYILKVETYWLK